MANESMKSRIELLERRREEVAAGGGERNVEKQHAQGKLTARERIEELVDPGTFQETGMFVEHRATMFGMAGREIAADAVVTGQAAVLGRVVHVASQDFTASGGTIGEVHADKVEAALAAALKTGTPFIFINDSGGARVQEGIVALDGCGRIFYHNVLLSGVVPQITILAGPCAGAAAYSPALTDFIIQTRAARMFITGPDVIQQVTGEVVSAEQLGGPDVHMARSGVVHFVAEDDRHALLIAKKLLTFLPSNNTEDPPEVESDDTVEPNPRLNDIVPADPKRPYDMREIIANVVDGADFLEVQAGYAGNVVVGFARMTGRTIGVVANQPLVLSGVLDINASDKITRFVRFCNAFNIPLLTFVDVPGFLPGVGQEYDGIIRHGAKVLFAYSAATVPKVTIIVRKAFGGGYIAMCSKALGADRSYAWPTAEVAVMGAEGAAEIVFRREIAAAEDQAAKRAELIETYRETFANPYVAASSQLVDDVIEPAVSRRVVAQAFEALTTKRDLRPAKKHGLIPM
ncbi:MAG: acyl-CoA carboxylase subunit beta [Mycobacterium leprae]